MKYSIKRKITLDITLDSSEAIMFTKGGRHIIKLDCIDDLFDENDSSCELEIGVQLERNEQGRFDFINTSAQQPRL